MKLLHLECPQLACRSSHNTQSACEISQTLISTFAHDSMIIMSLILALRKLAIVLRTQAQRVTVKILRQCGIFKRRAKELGSTNFNYIILAGFY